MAAENSSSSTRADPGAMSSGDPGLLIEYSSFRDFVDLCSPTLSELGMFIATDNPRPLGSMVRVELRIRDGFQLLEGQGEVVSIGGPTAGDGTTQGMSVRFKSIDEAGRRLLAKVVENHQRQGGTPFVPEAQEQPVPQPEPKETPPAVDQKDSDRVAGEIPGLGEIEASLKAQAQPEARPVDSDVQVEAREEPPSTQVQPPPGMEEPPSTQVQPPADMEERPSTLVEPPPDMVAPAPSGSDQSFADLESVGSTIIVPPAETPAAGLPTGSPSVSPPVAQEPPMELAPPPDPAGPIPGIVPPQESAPVAGLGMREMAGEDVQWEEPVAISEPGSVEEPTAPEPEKRFTDGLPDVPPPDELVVASGTLRWPDETGALTTRSGPTLPPPVPELSPEVGVQRRKSHALRTFLLLILVTLLAGAGFYRYRERLMPYVETYVEPYAGPTISRVRNFVQSQLDRIVGVDEPDQEWAEPALGDTAEPLDETAAPAEGEMVRSEPRPSEVPVRRPIVSEVSQIDRISWEELAGETLLILWTDGPIRREQVELARMETGGIRAIIKIIGIKRQPQQTNITVGTSHVDRIRAGLHQEPVGSVLHIVADLTDIGVYVRAVEPQGSRLEIYFARR